jgi:hypothetical protein
LNFLLAMTRSEVSKNLTKEKHLDFFAHYDKWYRVTQSSGQQYCQCPIFCMLHGHLRWGYVFLGLSIVWINVNTGPYYKRATAIAMNQIIGNIGGVFAGQIYLAIGEPHYMTGQAVSFTACGLACCGVCVMLFYLCGKNCVRGRKLHCFKMVYLTRERVTNRSNIGINTSISVSGNRDF